MKRAIKRGRMFSLLFLLFSFTAVAVYLFFPSFHYSRTTILGETSLNAERLLEMAKVETKKNIFFIDIRQAEKNIAQSPMIKEIQISRKFPSTLIFSVQERLEVGAVSFDGGFAIIDDEGMVMKIVQNLQEVKKPIIVGLQISTVKLGEKIPVEDTEQFALIMGLISGAQNAKLMDIISDVQMSDIRDVRMTTVNGITVLLGEGKDLNYKMLALHQILLDLHSRNIHHGIVDMRYDSYPVYREG